MLTKRRLSARQGAISHWCFVCIPWIIWTLFLLLISSGRTRRFDKKKWSYPRKEVVCLTIPWQSLLDFVLSQIHGHYLTRDFGNDCLISLRPKDHQKRQISRCRGAFSPIYFLKINVCLSETRNWRCCLSGLQIASVCWNSLLTHGSCTTHCVRNYVVPVWCWCYQWRTAAPYLC